MNCQIYESSERSVITAKRVTSQSRQRTIGSRPARSTAMIARNLGVELNDDNPGIQPIRATGIVGRVRACSRCHQKTSRCLKLTPTG